MTNEILINNRVNQVTGATDWLTFADAGFPDLPEVYTIVDLDANRATDGGHYRNLYGIRLGKIPDPDTLRIFEYLADSNSDSFDSDTEAGAEYTRAASWPPGAGEFATSGNGDIVYFHASQVGVQVAVLPYQFRCTPLTLEKIKAFAQAAVSGSELEDIVGAAIDATIDTAIDVAITEAIEGPIQNNIDAAVAPLEPLADYSTSEVAIGTWIDARTIYRKVLTPALALGTQGYYDTAHGITGLTSGVSECLRVYGKFHADSTPEESLSIGANYLQPVIQMTNGGNARIYSPANLTSFTVDYIVLEYVK